MKKFTSIFLFYLLLSSCSQDKVVHGEKKQYRYYDFDVLVEVINPWIEGPEEKYIIENTQNGFYDEGTKVWTESKLRPKILYKVTFLYNRDQNHSSSPVQIDTIKTELTNTQLDTLYSLTTELFRVEKRENISPDSIQHHFNHHGRQASVLLDLGNRGDLYKASIKVAGPTAFTNKKYKTLYNFLQRITNH